MTKVTVSGSRGRMGSMILDLATKDLDIQIVGRFDKGEDSQEAIKACDVLVEFTTPQATLENLKTALEHKKAVVIGTTGLSEREKKVIEDASRSIPIVMSPNMAIGVNLLFKLVKETARILDRSYAASVSETHHVHKKDAPSGTAKSLQQLIAAIRNMSLDDIMIDSKREGEVTGNHTVLFDSLQETLTFKHSAKTREVFAKGALEAAKFLAGKKPALYNMFDVLGLK